MSWACTPSITKDVSPTLSRAVPTILDRSGIKGREPVIRTTPDLSFLMEGQGKTWRVFYNTQLGRLSGRPEQAPGPLSTRRFLILLHVAHGFPAKLDYRWIWAVTVDLMFVSMVGWGLTGILMWWQMKNVRRVGIAVLCASAAAATALAIGMHQIFTM